MRLHNSLLPKRAQHISDGGHRKRAGGWMAAVCSWLELEKKGKSSLFGKEVLASYFQEAAILVLFAHKFYFNEVV